MSKIIINKQNEVTLLMELGLGELVKQSENHFCMKISSTAGKELMKENILKLAKKKEVN